MQDNNPKSGPEQRKHTRIDSSMSVDYSTYSPYHIRRITNISKGGVFIRTQEIFPVGTVMDISFRLPEEEQQIQSKVRVIWTYRQPSTVSMNSSGMGVQFIEINDDDMRRIQAFIDAAASDSKQD